MISFLTKHQTKIENLLAFFVIVSAVFQMMHWAYGAKLLMISISSLAVYYFLSAYLPSPIENLFAIIAWRLVGINSSVCVIGILFGFLHLSGAADMLVIGAIGLFISGIAFLFFAMRQWSYRFLPLFVRIAFFVFMAGSMIMSLAKFK
jgi:hypothetical protein